MATYKSRDAFLQGAIAKARSQLPPPAPQNAAPQRTVAPRPTAAHPGFQAVARRMAARQGISTKHASAELATSSRGASFRAKRRNPRLTRVRG